VAFELVPAMPACAEADELIWVGRIGPSFVERRFEPRMPQSQARHLRERWNEAVSRTKSWELP